MSGNARQTNKGKKRVIPPHPEFAETLPKPTPVLPSDVDLIRVTDVFEFIERNLDHPEIIQGILDAGEGNKTLRFEERDENGRPTTFTLNGKEDLMCAVLAIAGYSEERLGVLHDAQELQLYRVKATRFQPGEQKKHREKLFDPFTAYKSFAMSWFHARALEKADFDPTVQALYLAGRKRGTDIEGHAPVQNAMRMDMPYTENFNINGIQTQNALIEQEMARLGENDAFSRFRPGQPVEYIAIATPGSFFVGDPRAPQNTALLETMNSANQALADAPNEQLRQQILSRFPTFPSVATIYQSYLATHQPQTHEAFYIQGNGVNRAVTVAERSDYLEYARTHPTDVPKRNPSNLNKQQHALHPTGTVESLQHS